MTVTICSGSQFWDVDLIRDIKQTPDYNLPDLLGLSWKMTKVDCISQLNFESVEKDSHAYYRGNMKLDSNMQLLSLSLFFVKSILSRICIDWAISDGFWKSTTYEELEKTQTKFTNLYKELVRHYEVILGSPKYVGCHGMSGYPESEIAWQLSCWQLPEWRFQIELDHPDKEYPFFLKICWYPEH